MYGAGVGDLHHTGSGQAPEKIIQKPPFYASPTHATPSQCLHLNFGHNNHDSAIMYTPDDSSSQYWHFWEVLAQNSGAKKTQLGPNWLFLKENDAMHRNKGKKFITHQFLKNQKKSDLQRMVPSVGEIFDVCLCCFKEIRYKKSVWAFSLSIVPQALTKLCLFDTA